MEKPDLANRLVLDFVTAEEEPKMIDLSDMLAGLSDVGASPKYGSFAQARERLALDQHWSTERPAPLGRYSRSSITVRL